jgi:hypothetical protein
MNVLKKKRKLSLCLHMYVLLRPVKETTPTCRGNLSNSS